MEHEITCPGCQATALSPYLNVKDHFLTKESFELQICEACKLISTFPRPQGFELGRYYKSSDYVSHTSTSKGIVNKVYNVVRRISLRQKVRLIRSLSTGKHLLDIGAGTGHFLNAATASGFTTIGLEPDDAARQVALDLHELELLPLEALDSLPEASFDVITMWHVLEHVYHLTGQLESIVSKLKPGASLVVAVPNCKSLDAAHYGPYWAAYDVPRHLYHFTPESLIPLVEKFGLSYVKMLPMKFDAYYVSMLSERYQGGNVLSGVLQGFRSNLRAKNGEYSSQIYIFKRTSAF